MSHDNLAGSVRATRTWVDHTDDFNCVSEWAVTCCGHIWYYHFQRSCFASW